MSEVLNEIMQKETYEQALTNYVNDLRNNSKHNGAELFSKLRGFPLEYIESCGIFYIGEMTEMLLPKYFDDVKDFGVISPTNNKPIFSNRYIIPILNEKGLVQNLVGYSKEADERYIYGKAKYYRRKDTPYGLENLDLAYDMGYAIITEGITDTIRLRSLGYLNTFAMCGTHESDYIVKLFNRCRHGIIRVPDRDKAGARALNNWKFNRHVTLYTNFQYKDIDEMCSIPDNVDWLHDYMRDCINWITSDTHNGKRCICESVTIL